MSVIWQRSTHGVQRHRSQANQSLARMLIIAAVIATLLAIGYLTLIASNVALAREIWKIHLDLANLRRENSEIMVEIARNGSIPVLQERSVRLGYQPATQIDFMVVQEP